MRTAVKRQLHRRFPVGHAAISFSVGLCGID
jgi:hypothetical protein